MKTEENFFTDITTGYSVEDARKKKEEKERGNKPLSVN
jgi:hypothetical protein